MKILRSLIAVLVLSTWAVGQQTASVVGNIREGSTVANQVVKLVSETQTFETVTDPAGNYRFENVPNGQYLLVFQNRQARVTIENGVVSMTRLADVVVVAANEAQTVEQVSKTVDVITGQEMRDRADFTLVETLRTIPGFRVQQSGGFGRLASIKTRGLRNQDTAILIDGIRFRDPAAERGDASPFLSDITLTSVNKIEVLRGSGSSMYGTNAIGGTVDLQTPRSRTGTHGQLSGAFGGLGLGRFRGNVSHGTGGGRFGISAGLSRTVYTKGIDGDDEAHNTNFQARLDADPFARTSISGRLFISRADVQLNSSPDTAGVLPATNRTVIAAVPGVTFSPDANDPDDIQRSRFFSAQFNVNHVVNEKLVLGGYYQGLKTRRANESGPLGIGFQSAATSIFEGSIHTANTFASWTPNTHHLIKTGYEFEAERFGNEGRSPAATDNFFTRAGQRSNTFYFQDLISVGRLQLAGGFRVQQFNLSTPEFSAANAPYTGLTLDDPPTAYTFDGSASYYFRSTGTKLRAHVGNGYRVPSLYERFGTFFSTFGGAAFIALGDPGLKPEKSIAFDAGVEQDLARERLRLSGTYFYTHLQDIIGFGNVVPPIGPTTRPFGGYQNQKGGIARGAEFSGRVRPGRSTDIFASYTFTNSDQREPQVAGSAVVRTLGIPDHQLTMVATQRFGRLWINFDLLATSDYIAPIFSNAVFQSYIYRFEGNRKADLTAGYTFGLGKDGLTLRVCGTIENLFDHEYFENGFRTAGRVGRVGLNFSF
ncbi:MAG: TonB-dependent receptor domain-containing protein [Pyrinomonadaceae bacterium]